ncbi:MAG: AMP-binding protein, partial [Pseudomonadota bacterium]
MPNPLYDRLFGNETAQDAPFLHIPGAETVTYGAFRDRTAQFAHVLTDLGLSPGDRLAAQVEKSPEALIVYAACAQTGVVFLPLNTAYTPSELSYFIQNSGAALVVADASGALAIS